MIRDTMIKMGQKMAGCIEWYDDTTTQIYNNWIRVNNQQVFFIKSSTFFNFYNLKSGCWSYLGQTTETGAQDLNLGNGCVHPMIIEHEFLHAMGMLHEQEGEISNKHQIFLNIEYLKILAN